DVSARSAGPDELGLVVAALDVVGAALTVLVSVAGAVVGVTVVGVTLVTPGMLTRWSLLEPHAESAAPAAASSPIAAHHTRRLWKDVCRGIDSGPDGRDHE